MSPARATSLALFCLGLLACGSWCAWQIQAFAAERQGVGCGLPILGIYGTALAGMGLVSLPSALLNARDYRRNATTRSLSRRLECGLLGAPALFCLAGAAWLLYAF